MSDPFATICSRTDAVLATHLDGELRGERGEPGCEATSAGGSAEGSLQPHLRDCPVCQRALQRARRLDAALASTAGRAVAAHALSSDGSLEALGDRLLQNAVDTASTPTPRVDQEAGQPTTGQPTTSGETTDELSLPWTLFAAAGLLAAGLATWLLLFATHARTATRVAVEPAAAESAAALADAPSLPLVASEPVASEPAASEPVASESALPLDLARRLNERVRAEQATPDDDELAHRLADEAQPLTVRRSAGKRLLAAARGPAPRAHAALDTLLVALAALGDDTDVELALQDELLDEVRSAVALSGRIATRIHELSAAHPGAATAPATVAGLLHDAAGSVALSRADLAALVVAARAGGERLDVALRRAMQRHPPLANVTTSALRSVARQRGGAALLLQGWQDQVALGRQQDSPPWAEFWFRGQSPRTFEQVAALLQRSRSVTERTRCLLALGCVGDDSTVAVLRAHLRSASREEAFAATCALSSLPHSVLAPLLPDAGAAPASLLRTALARAGLPQARPWIAGLSSSQRRLLLEARPEQFPEVTGWFREPSRIAD